MIRHFQMPSADIAALWNSLPLETDAESVVAFVRAVERFHGIGAPDPFVLSRFSAEYDKAAVPADAVERRLRFVLLEQKERGNLNTEAFRAIERAMLVSK